MWYKRRSHHIIIFLKWSWWVNKKKIKKILTTFHFVALNQRPGSDYMVRVTSVTKGHRIRSQPVRLSMSQVMSAGPAPDEVDGVYLSPPSYPPHLMEDGFSPLLPPFIAPPPPSSQSRNYRPTGNFTSILADYRFPPTANSAGVVYVRGEEVGIVILVLIGKSRDIVNLEFKPLSHAHV